MKFLLKTVGIAAGCLLSQLSSAVSCVSMPSWASSDVYTKSDQVQYMNMAYEAKWWTRNNNPATSDEWKSLGACDGGGGNIPPVATINGPYSGVVGNNVVFSSIGSSDANGTITQYQWDFGDGSMSDQDNPSHAYASAGSYTVMLTVTDNDGASTTANTMTIISTTGGGGGGTAGCEGIPSYQAGNSYAAGDHVSNVLNSTGETMEYVCEIAGWCSLNSPYHYEPGNGTAWDDAWNLVGACSVGGNRLPIAVANGPYSGVAEGNVNFSSDGSNDPDGTIASYQWAFGDGATSDQANPSHIYSAAGMYTVSLMVTDAEGASSSISTTANITQNGNASPTANANGPYSGTPGNAINFSSAGSNDSDGSITQYAWDFGDGASSTQANPSHMYTSDGSYTISLTVTDNQGATNVATTIANISDGSSSGKKVVGYFAQWGVYGRNYHVKNIVTSGSAEKLTHLVYAFGNVTNGRCVIGDNYADYDRFYDANSSVDGQPDSWDTGSLRGSFNQLRKLKQMYPHIKIVWSFGGWTWSGGFGQAAANPHAFAESCYNLVHDRRWDGVFDGIDIDWEYPNECGLSCDTSGFSAYGNLMQALRARFGNELVTAAIGAGPAKLNAANYGEAAQYVDFYMLMTYDYFGAWDSQGPTAPHSPLYDFANIPVAGFYSDNSLQILKSKGVASDKILLGIGFYGRGWTGVTQSAPGGSASGAAPGTYEQGIEDYKVLKNTCPATGTFAGTAYAHCGNNWWSFDTPATINSKMGYANTENLGGAFFWELSGDTADGELIKAIKSGL